MDKFLEVNVGNVVTWAFLVVGFIVSYVRQSDRVDRTKDDLSRVVEEFKKRMDNQDRMLEEIKTTGSPSSRTAIMILNSRVEGQGSRVAELEKIALVVSGMARD